MHAFAIADFKIDGFEINESDIGHVAIGGSDEWFL